MKTLVAISDKIDACLERLFKLASVLSVFLVFAITLQVVLRYMFDRTNIMLEESQWHLYGILIMMGIGYCQVKNTHVRVDVLSHIFSKRTKLIVEVAGTIFIFFPFFIVVFLHSLDYFLFSFMTGETSDAPSGLPFRWFIKAFIPLGFLLMSVACVTNFIRSIDQLINRK